MEWTATPLPARNVADDGLSRDRIAALGAVDQQIVRSLDLQNQVAGWPSVGGGGRRRDRTGGSVRLLGLVLHGLGRQLLENLARREAAVAQGGVQILHLAVAVLAGYPLQFRLADPVQ